MEYLKRVLKRLGLKGYLHTFRHSFINHAAIQSVLERIVRAWVGHVDQQVLAWYFHLADSQSLAAMQKLSRAEAGQFSSLTTGSVSAHFQHNDKEVDHDISAN